MGWIKTDEKMPPPGKSVLLLQETGYKNNKVIIVGFFAEKHTLECDEDYAEYCEEKDEYFAPEGFYENQYNWGEFASIGVHENEAITHWMPLPEPPEA